MIILAFLRRFDSSQDCFQLHTSGFLLGVGWMQHMATKHLPWIIANDLQCIPDVTGGNVPNPLGAGNAQPLSSYVLGISRPEAISMRYLFEPTYHKPGSGHLPPG